MRKWLIIIIVVVVLIAAVFVRISTSRRGRGTEAFVSRLTVEVTPVVRGDVMSTCEVLGTVTADKTAQVFPETMGRITRIVVKEGTYVAKDANLMALRTETIGFEYEEGFVRAPISGNIAKIMIDVGSMVTPQVPVAVVMDYSKVNIQFNVAETNIGCVKKNDRVTASIDALPGQAFTGTVSEITPVVDPLTRTLDVKASVPNAGKALRPGMTARITLNLGERKNVVIIPRDALLNGHVFVVNDSIAERRDVIPGLIGDSNAEIKSGISEGERVVIVGQQRLTDGEKVNTVLRSEL